MYKQEFNSNIYDPGKNSGLGLYAYDGYFKGYTGDLWKSDSLPLTFGYEGRLYLPTYSSRRDAGMITFVRNYLRLTYKFSNSFNVVLDEIPVLHIYNQAGSVTSSGATANPFFEDKIELTPNYNITQTVRLSIPIKYSATRYSTYLAGSKFNNGWGHYLYVWPEINWAFAPNMRVGLAYYSDNMVAPDFSKTTFSDGFKLGTTQMIFAASL